MAYDDLNKLYKLNKLEIVSKVVKPSHDLLDYDQIQEDDIYKYYFGKSYQDDPMLYYDQKHEKTRVQYENELNKFRFYQSMKIK